MTITVSKESEGQVYLRTSHWVIRDLVGQKEIKNLEAAPKGVTINFADGDLYEFSWQELDNTARNIPIETISLVDGTLKNSFSVGSDYLSGQFKFNHEGLTTDPTGEVVFQFQSDKV